VACGRFGLPLPRGGTHLVHCALGCRALVAARAAAGLAYAAFPVVVVGCACRDGVFGAAVIVVVFANSPVVVRDQAVAVLRGSDRRPGDLARVKV